MFVEQIGVSNLTTVHQNGARNSARLRASGDGQRSTIIQQGGTVGRQNGQHGFYWANTATLQQSGLHNNAQVLQGYLESRHLGLGNSAEQQQIGPGNQASIAQRGSDLSGQQTQIGSTNRVHLQQSGNSHKAVQEQIGSGLQHSLSQSGPGTGVPVIIQQQTY